MDSIHLPIDRWRNKKNVLYKHIGIFFSIINDEILQHTITWKSIEGIMPGEISQTKKGKYC